MTPAFAERDRSTGEQASQTRRPAYWAATLLVAAAFLVPGILNLMHAPHVAGDMAHLGYPRYFSTILGTWKLLAAAAVLAPGTPRIKEWAYAGMMFDLTGAAASRLIVGDPGVTIAVPLLIACVVAISWRLRPASRRLVAAASVRDRESFVSSGDLVGAARGGSNP